MGASYAEVLSKNGHDVYGYDLNHETLQIALADQVIKDKNIDLIKTSDLVILALYPKDNIDFIKTHQHLFNNQLITDIAGTKTHMIQALIDILPKNVRYVSHHPMAGREKKGYLHKDITMFKNANFLIVETPNSAENDIQTIAALGKEMGFGKITRLTPKEHDELIAHTSQLTHLLAVGLMLSDNSLHTKDATGDSFRDLTRIAKINEDMWTELFLDNKDALIQETDRFIETLELLKELIKNNRGETLKNKLREAKEKRFHFDEHKS